MPDHKVNLAPQAFDLQITQKAGTAVLSLSGELDLGCVERLGKALAEITLQAEQVIVDMREVTFMDSSALRVLLRLWSESRKNGFSLAIVRPRPEVQKVFEVTGADKALPMIDVLPEL
jgi:anti-sigma B factor antagonist